MLLHQNLESFTIVIYFAWFAPWCTPDEKNLHAGVFANGGGGGGSGGGGRLSWDDDGLRLGKVRSAQLRFESQKLDSTPYTHPQQPPIFGDLLLKEFDHF